MNATQSHSDLVKVARTILKYTSESLTDIATYGFKGRLMKGISAEDDTELRNIIQDEAKTLTATL